ncbi:hypothetical protein KSP40_PGU011812 [Platanthera guangdongensis]|uniref:Uncharacterized protein n=1 Tax=Platanthera guangdongensis TaxID=2320717 RepID=A0ABR2MHX9_9ASPA
MFPPAQLEKRPKKLCLEQPPPPPVRTLHFHPPDRPATAKTNEALVRWLDSRILKGNLIKYPQTFANHDPRSVEHEFFFTLAQDVSENCDHQLHNMHVPDKVT